MKHGLNFLRGLRNEQTNVPAFNRFIIFALYPVAVHIVLILQDKICWSGTDLKTMILTE